MSKKIRLGDIATLITKGTTPTSVGYNFTESGVNFVKIESIREDGTFIPEKFAHISDECNIKLKRSQLQENDILFSIAGAIGRTAVVTKECLPANTNQALAIIRIPQGVIDYRFLLYALQSDAVMEQSDKQKQGVAQLNLSLQNINDFEIPFFTEKEQNEIVEVLSSVDDLLRMRTQQLEQLDELVKSRFIELFGDPIANTKGLPVKTLKQLSTLITNGNTPKGGSENYVSDGILFLRSQNVWRNRIDLEDVAYIDESTHLSMKKSIVKHKDILITKTGRINTENSSLGRAALFLGKDNSANINGHVYLVRLDGSVVPEFVITILTSEEYRKYIRKVCVGGIDKRQINLDQVEEFPIIIPAIEQQTEFAAFVEHTDKLKFTVRNTITIYTALILYFANFHWERRASVSNKGVKP